MKKRRGGWHPDHPQVLSCETKIPLGAAEAEREADRLRRRTGEHRIQAYRCEVCLQHHVGRAHAGRRFSRGHR